MTNETFDFIWNGFGTKNSMTAKRLLRLKKTIKQFHQSKSRQNPNGENKMTDTTTENRTTKRIPTILPREYQTTVRMRYMRF